MKARGRNLVHVFMPVLVGCLLLLTYTAYSASPTTQKSTQPAKTATSAASPASIKYDPNAPPKGTITIPASSKGNVNASSWYTGSYQYIQWTCSGTYSNLVDVTLWQNNKQVAVISKGIASGQTGYRVPWSTAAGQYELRVTSEDDPRIEAKRAVGIVSTTLTITTPKKDDIWHVGGTYQIAWQIQGTPVSVNASLWQMGVNKYFDIGTGMTGGSTTYTVPLNFPQGGCYLIVGGKDSPELKDMHYLAVLLPTVTVTSPKASDRWTTGSTYPITWQFTGNPGPLKIELFNASNSFIIADNVPPGAAGSGKYDWKVIDLMTSSYHVRITSQTFGSVTSSSPTVYFQNPPPPPGKYVKWQTTYCGNFGCNAVWQKPFPIKWSYNDCGDTIDITIYEKVYPDTWANLSKHVVFDLKKYPISKGPLTWIPPLPPQDCGGGIRCRQYLVRLVSSGGCEDTAQIDEF
jgi:hypothetical protein